MFTGIVLAIGQIVEVLPQGGDTRLRIDSKTLDLDKVAIGDSISVSGTCLTVIEKSPQTFTADVSAETLKCTNLSHKVPGSQVNLETSLTLSTALSGHLVTGHIDGIGTLLERQNDGCSIYFHCAVPKGLNRFIAEKGSVCVDGVSLAVNRIDAKGFSVNIIPHTLEQTTLGELTPGMTFNLEIDLVARYVARLQNTLD